MYNNGNSSTTIRLLETTFNLPLQNRNISRWRGAWAEFAGLEADLFHNHHGEKSYYYRYPKVQYRTRNGQASILVINEGVEALQHVLAKGNWKITWDTHPFVLQIEKLQLREYQATMTDDMRHYRLRQWVPFNVDNFERWKHAANLIERANLLNRVLVGHILDFATALQWRLPERLEVELQNLRNIRSVNIHGISRPVFDIEFTANVLLPPAIGLGKATSHGFGQTFPLRTYNPSFKDDRKHHLQLADHYK
ncbi:MAG: CRISPR-associated endonuclease Cas6 [Saprospiraceae bacterium]|nr:hypothetical protein [Lewinella sp.]